MDKEIKEAIIQIMDVESNLEQEFVIDLIKKLSPELDIEKLKEREYKKMANRLISSFKDEKGIRDVFVITNDMDMSEYINVTRSKEVDDLNKVRDRLENNVAGNQRSLEKVEDRLYLLKNQISINEVVRDNVKSN